MPKQDPKGTGEGGFPNESKYKQINEQVYFQAFLISALIEINEVTKYRVIRVEASFI
jgi:hypothetical protein